MARIRTFAPRTLALTAALAALLASAQPAGAAPAVNGSTPIAQYWMDIATFNMMGMDEMPEMAGMGGGMLSGMMNRNSRTGRDGRHAKGVGNFGETRGGGIGRRVDIALYTRDNSAGTSALQQVPAGADLGAAPLHLITPPRESVQAGGDTVELPERPRGRILFYWGCSADIKAGQPRILDMSKLSAQDYAGFMQGRHVADRGARAEAGHAIWPNERENSHITRRASLVGEHTVSGDGVPAGLSFRIDERHDFMPSLKVDSAGDLAASIRVHWQPVDTARAYLLTAMSGGMDGNNAPEMVIWSSSEPPESGFGLLDYISNANIDKWLKERVLLAPSQTECAIPKGIFANSQGAMLQAIAYGDELNLVHPPRPADPKAAWKPEWSVRVRNKSVAMNMLGQDNPAMPAQRGESRRRNQEQEDTRPGARKLLKGLFGH
ncbi:MAG: hypothetical protein KIS89_04725 [Dokdonella sp.]|nr:hypothetical protein [Dokdonella sp.]